jgi:DNA-binding PadR family transcriptional regulator
LTNNQEHIALTEGVYYILLALQQPMHGYAITQFIKEISGSRVELGPGTLYGALKSLVEKEWIELQGEDSSSRRKEYQITDLGKEVLHSEMKRLEELLENGYKMTRGGDHDN